MTLSTTINAALDVIYSSSCASAITYDGASIYAIVSDEELDEMYSRASNKRICSIDVRSADVSQPDYRDSVIINGVTWQAKSWQLMACGAQWRVWLERDIRQLMRAA